MAVAVLESSKTTKNIVRIARLHWSAPRANANGTTQVSAMATVHASHSLPYGAERIRHETFASEMTQFRKGDIDDIEVRPLLALARARRLAHAHLRET
jgi:hypothetical protein